MTANFSIESFASLAGVCRLNLLNLLNFIEYIELSIFPDSDTAGHCRSIDLSIDSV